METKLSHQLGNRRIPMAKICPRNKKDLSFNRTTMEK
jgi:hypothetical protein